MEVIVPTESELAIMKGTIIHGVNNEIRPPAPADVSFFESLRGNHG